MSDVDDQGSLPSYVEHDAGRSPRAKDVPAAPEPDDAGQERVDDEMRSREREEQPAAETPFEPSVDDAGDDEVRNP